MKTKINATRISWIDSAHMPSHIHLTADSVETLCGDHAEFIANRVLKRSPSKERGQSNYCRICFKNGGKSLPWNEKCKE